MPMHRELTWMRSKLVAGEFEVAAVALFIEHQLQLATTGHIMILYPPSFFK